MWLDAKKGGRLKGENGFLVSADPGNHPKHSTQLRTRLPVARKLADETDAAAEAAGLATRTWCTRRRTSSGMRRRTASGS